MDFGDVPAGEFDHDPHIPPGDEIGALAQDFTRMAARLKELQKTNPVVADIIAVAEVLEGLPRHASTHASAVVIADRPLIDYLPLYKGSKGEQVTQFDMKYVEDSGLVKFDFLGLKTLTVIRNTCEMIKKSKGITVDVDQLPLDDAKAYLRERYGEDRQARFGLVASSKDRDLFHFGIPNDFQSTKQIRIGPWYGDDEQEDGGRSCRRLKTCVTEFGAQIDAFEKSIEQSTRENPAAPGAGFTAWGGTVSTGHGALRSSDSVTEPIPPPIPPPVPPRA